MAKYRHRPTIVEAQQWFPGVELPGVQSLGPHVFGVPEPHGGYRHLAPGDWIIQTGFPIPDVLPNATFEVLYERLEEG
jgi:hypothetical protein